MRNIFQILYFLIGLVPLTGNCQLNFHEDWVKLVGGSLGHRSLYTIQRNENNFLFAGAMSIHDTGFGCCNQNTPLGTDDAWLLITDTNANKIWSHCYGGNNGDWFFKAQRAKDNSIWTFGQCGSTDGDFPNTGEGSRAAIIKFDSIGNIIFYKFYGMNPGGNLLGDFITTSDGGAIFSLDFNYATGNIPYKYGNDPFTTDTWLCKLDSNGLIQWDLVLGGTGTEQSRKIKELQPGQYSVLMRTNSIDSMLLGLNFNDSVYSPWLVEVDTGGHILSSQVVQNIIVAGEQGYDDFLPTIDGGVLLAGGIYPVSGGNCYPPLLAADFALVKANHNYQYQWCNLFGGFNDNGIEQIVPMNDSIIAFGGSSASPFDTPAHCAGYPYHVRFGVVNSNTQQLIWQKDLCGSGDNEFESLYYDTLSNALYVLVATNSMDGDFAGVAVNDSGAKYLLKYTVDTVTGINQLSPNINSLMLHPNPTTNYVIANYNNYHPGMISAIYNCLGQVVQQQAVTGSYQQIDVSHLQAGLYMICIKQGNEVVASGKFVKE